MLLRYWRDMKYDPESPVGVTDHMSKALSDAITLHNNLNFHRQDFMLSQQHTFYVAATVEIWHSLYHWKCALACT